MTLRTTAVLIGCVRAASGAMGVAGVRRATVHASASSAAKPAVLWLHGLGDTGAGWQGAFGPLAAAATFHHPTAPTAPVTINGGMQSTSWMDLKSFPVDLSEPEAGSDFDATVASVHGMLEQIEADGTPAEQILIGGFSQGGATSLAAGLAYPRRLAGIVSISGWVALALTLTLVLTLSLSLTLALALTLTRSPTGKTSPAACTPPTARCLCSSHAARRTRWWTSASPSARARWYPRCSARR